MTDCPHCGREAADGDLFCRGCGQELGEPKAAVLVATLGPTTPWAGKHVTYENGQFHLEDVGVLSAENLLTYDRSGHLIWAREDLKDWVRGLAGGSTPVSPTPSEQPKLPVRSRRRDLPKAAVAAVILVAVCGGAIAWWTLGSSSHSPKGSSGGPATWENASAGDALVVSYDPTRFSVKSTAAPPGAGEEIEIASQGSGQATLSISVNDMGSSFTTASLIKMVTGIVSKTKKVAGSSGRVSPYSAVDSPALGANGLSFDAVVPTTTGQVHMRGTYLMQSSKLVTILAQTDTDSWSEWEGSLDQITASIRKPGSGSTQGELVAMAKTSQVPVKLSAFPDVANETVTFIGSNSASRGRVYVQDPTLLKTYPVSAASAYAGMPATSSRYVVWMQAPSKESSNYDIWAYDLAQGVAFPLAEDSTWQGQPDVAGDWAVWVDAVDSNSDVYAYSFSDETKMKISGRAGELSSPSTDGRWVVWEYEPKGAGVNAESDVMGYDLKTKREFVVCSAPGSQLYASVSDGYVVWKDFRNGSDNPDIYGFDLRTQKEFVISDAPGEQSEPAITDGMVLYRSSESGSGSSVLMGYDIASGVTSEVYSSADSPGFCKAGEGSFVFSTASYGGPTTLRMGLWR